MSPREISMKISMTKAVRRVLIITVVGEGCSQRSEKQQVCPEEPRRGSRDHKGDRVLKTYMLFLKWRMEQCTSNPHPTSWPPRARRTLKGKHCWPITCVNFASYWVSYTWIIHQVSFMPDICSSSILLDEWKFVPFFRWKYSIVWTYHNLLIYFPVDGHLDWFQFGTCMNKAAVLIHFLLRHDVFISLG